ncbi:hypothetical protein AJ88_07255 [Mesorhizobium amorphae CCBAU 01583]|nr:hypothetical protein AJ88_07255 [Mesorhizobium amorphae CCBAU 01583]
MPAFGADRPAGEQRGLDDARDLAEGAACACRREGALAMSREVSDGRRKSGSRPAMSATLRRSRRWTASS